MFLFLLRKSKKGGAIRRNVLFMDPVWDSLFVLHVNGESQTGTRAVTRVGSATEMESDQTEFILRPVPCKRMKRNVWRPIRTHAVMPV